MYVFLDTSFIEDLYGKLIPNLFSFLIQLIALIVLVILIIILAYKPVKKILKKRQDFIENNINESINKNSKANELLNESQKQLSEVSLKANDLINNAKKVALLEQEKIKETTALEIKKMKEDASNEIEQMKKEANEDIRKEIIDVAILASSKLIERNIDNADNKKLVDDFIKEIEE